MGIAENDPYYAGEVSDARFCDKKCKEESWARSECTQQKKSVLMKSKLLVSSIALIGSLK